MNELQSNWAFDPMTGEPLQAPAPQEPVPSMEMPGDSYAAPMVDPYGNSYYAVPTPVAPPKRKKWVPILIIAVAAVLLAALALGAWYMFGGNSKFVMIKQQFVNDEEGNIYLNGKKVAEVELEDGEYMYGWTGYDGKRAYFYVTNYDEKGDTLYIVTEKGDTEIADGVKSYGCSDNIEYLLYAELDEEGETEAIVWYDVAKKRRETLDDATVAILSPDGKTVAYAEADEDDGEVEYTTFVKTWGGKATEIDLKNATPQVVSNNAKHLYLTKPNDEGAYALYRSINKKEPEKVASDLFAQGHYWDGRPYLGIQANFDGTEIMYSTGEEWEKRTYYWVDGNKNPVKMGKGNVECVLPSDAQGVKTFKGQVFLYGDDNLGYFDGKDMHKIDSDVEGAFVAQNGKLYYTAYDDEEPAVYYVKNAYSPNTDPVKVEDEAEGAIVTPDGKYAYGVNEDEDEVLVFKNGKKVATISIDGENLIGMSTKGVLYATDEDRTLYAVDGTKKVKIADLSDDEARLLSEMRYNNNYGIGEYLYYTDGDDVYYVDGTKAMPVK